MKQVFTIVLTIITLTSNAQWVQLKGPTGGDVSNPIEVGNYIFVNGGPGGVFRSEDKGLSWTSVNNGLPDYPHCYDLTKSGLNIYCSINNAGIYYSKDFGKNWIAINKGIETLTSYGLFVNGNYIYATSESGGGGFYFSTNHGITWSFHQGILQGIQIRKFVISGNKLIAAGNGVYASEDSGLTWTNLNTSVSSTYAMGAAENTIYISGGQPLHISRDNGTTWSTINIGATSIYAIGDNVYLGGGGTIFYSSDKGQSWTSKTHPLTDNLHNGILESNGSLFLTTNVGIMYSSDNGDTWIARNNGLVNHVIKRLKIQKTSIFAATNYGLQLSRDSGDSWEKEIIGYATGGSNGINDIYLGDNYMIVGAQSGIFKSMDEGQTWAEKSSSPSAISVETVSGKNNRIIAAVNTKGVYTSIDHGESWVLKSSSLFDNVGYVCSSVKGDTLVVGAFGDLFISINFGDTWHSSKITPGYFYPTSVTFLGSKLIVSSAQGIFQSIDLGKNWLKTDKLSADVIINDLVISDMDNYFIATNQGIYCSGNQGVDWKPFNKGLGKAYTSTLALTKDFLFNGTYGMGIWKYELGAIKENQTIIFAALPDKGALDPAFELSATASSGLAVTYTSSDAAVATANGNKITIMGAGVTTITASQPGNAKFNPAIDVQQPLTVKTNLVTGDIITLDSELSVYPVPSKSEVIIKLSGFERAQIVNVLIHDMMGRVMETRQGVGGQKLTLSISNYAAGRYTVRAVQGKYRASKTLVKE